MNKEKLADLIWLLAYYKQDLKDLNDVIETTIEKIIEASKDTPKGEKNE